MEIIGIGDLFIPSRHIVEGFARNGMRATALEWGVETFPKLQEVNLLIEQKGPEAYEVPDSIIGRIREAEILITQFCPVNRKVIDCCGRLKLIGVLRGGYENIAVEYAASKGMSVFNTPGRNADSVADFTVGAMICEARNIARGHLGIKTGQWIREYPNSGAIPDMPGRVAGLVGFGEIGRKVARRLCGFDMEILAFDPFASGLPDYVKAVSLEELARRSDFVSLHARLTPENRHLIDAKTLSMMKPSAYLVNSSRAGLVDEKALLDALKSGRIAGAFLDVFEEEPPSLENPLVKLENVTLTPHMAGGSNDAFTKSPERLAAEIAKFMRGEPCRGKIK